MPTVVVHPENGNICVRSADNDVNIPYWLRDVVQPPHGTAVICWLCDSLGIWPDVGHVMEYMQAMIERRCWRWNGSEWVYGKA